MRHAAALEHPLGRLRSGRPGGSTARRRPGTGPRSGPAAAARARRARSASMSSTAAAPSEICDEVPAVCSPPSSTGLSPASASRRGVAQALVPVDRVSSVAAVLSNRATARPRGRSVPRPGRAGLALRRAGRTRRGPRGSARGAARSARRRELVGQVDVPGRRAGGRPRRRRALAPQRDPAHRLDAAGDADARSRRPRSGRRPGGRPAAPSRTARRCVGSRSCWGSPACSQAVRAMLLDCSPAWVTQPPTTCSTIGRVDAGAVEQRRLRARRAARRGAGRPARRRACRSGCGPPRRSPGAPWLHKLEHVLIRDYGQVYFRTTEDVRSLLERVQTRGGSP